METKNKYVTSSTIATTFAQENANGDGRPQTKQTWGEATENGTKDFVLQFDIAALTIDDGIKFISEDTCASTRAELLRRAIVNVDPCSFPLSRMRFLYSQIATAIQEAQDDSCVAIEFNIDVLNTGEGFEMQDATTTPKRQVELAKKAAGESIGDFPLTKMRAVLTQFGEAIAKAQEEGN